MIDLAIGVVSTLLVMEILPSDVLLVVKTSPSANNFLPPANSLILDTKDKSCGSLLTPFVNNTSPPSASKPDLPSTVNGIPPSECDGPFRIPPYSCFSFGGFIDEVD